jgi:hypothetical protein
MKRRLSLLVTAMLIATAGVVGVATPASAAVSPCTWIDPRALCTNPTTRLNLRTQPSTSSGIIITMDPDTIVWLHCWTTGQSINGDTVWYWVDDADEGFTVNPVSWPEGFAAGYYLATGPDPHPWVPHC